MYQFEMYAATHRGRIRQRNEDAYWFDTVGAVAVVADGMGGHPAGADASALAVQAFADCFAPDRSSDDDLGDTMANGVDEAHALIRATVDADPKLDGMGTTLTAIAFGPGSIAVVAQVGDSRAYRLRDRSLTRLTQDQTWVSEAIASGRLDPSAAETHPLSHVLSQAVGVDVEPTPVIDHHEVRLDDLYLLCSDGLTGPVPDPRVEEILTACSEGAGLDDAAEQLVEAALAGGGPDNVTVVLVRVTR